MFSNALLNAEPARYAMIVESILPPICILISGIWLNPGKQAGSNIQGRPKPIMFGIIWVILVLLWTLSLVIVALNTVDMLSLILIGILSFVVIFLCVLWMWIYKFYSKAVAAQILLLVLICMISCSVITVSSQTPSDAKIISAWFFSIIATWCGIASLYNYIEINQV